MKLKTHPNNTHSPYTDMSMHVYNHVCIILHRVHSGGGEGEGGRGGERGGEGGRGGRGGGKEGRGGERGGKGGERGGGEGAFTPPMRFCHFNNIVLYAPTLSKSSIFPPS